MALEGKVALVTGAARGIGKALTEILLQNGAKVALLDVDKNAGQEAVSAFDEEFGAGRSVFCCCDVSSEVQFRDAFEKSTQLFGGLDIICNNAGIVNESDWEKAVAVNLNGVIRGTFLALELMKKENGGRGGVIVNIASMAGLGPHAVAPVYTASKHGVVGFSRAIAEASTVLGYGVRINVLCPGFVQTTIFASLEKDEALEKLRNQRGKLLESWGILEPSDVAKIFLRIVLDDSSRNGGVLVITSKGAEYINFPTAADVPAATL
ncbi:15-hydroxyprostaglandin dehydrogenase [NAD(+)]-like [Denticeps clupeoides]|uniref:15-hydroxyprostaglandin dehydrogenase [NAD(+)] n=1 Tax=Denticeps clupeoides TaxID=299321 RepID=A0AAY4EG85_9TELE|nr:15-hydroxyprostaglandin dehydrogenase [NAD(+)]-like [Denticeps clupeoides]